MCGEKVEFLMNTQILVGKQEQLELFDFINSSENDSDEDANHKFTPN
jgi:hypothetical protein